MTLIAELFRPTHALSLVDGGTQAGLVPEGAGQHLHRAIPTRIALIAGFRLRGGDRPRRGVRTTPLTRARRTVVRRRTHARFPCGCPALFHREIRRW